MDSLAAILRRIPLFADLPPGSFAKIIADLREEYHPPQTVICYEGEAAYDFYIIKSGEVDVLINRAGNRREVVAISGAYQWFGERALFSDRPRSATIVARTEVELWRLTKEKFDALIEENPRLILHFTQVLSDRLYQANQELSKKQEAFHFQIDALFNVQPPARQEFLMHTAILATLDPPLVNALLGRQDAEQELAALTAQQLFVSQHEGRLRYPEAIREYLFSRLIAEVGTDGAQELCQRAATLHESAGQWDQAIDQYLEVEAFPAALHVLVTHSEEAFAAERFDLLGQWLARFPVAYRDHLAGLAQRLAHATQEHDTPPSSLPARQGRLPQISARFWRWSGGALGLAVGLGLWNLEPLPGLNSGSMHMLALLAWAVVFWALDVLPDYVVGLGLIIGWILFTIVPPEIAVSGFTTSPFFLIIGVLGITASLQSSGLLFRLALYILRCFPLTYRGQAAGLALSGSAITTFIPDSTSATAIAGPIILALSDSLGYARRSKGSAGLAMAALLGFGQMGPFFLTGAAENLLA